MAFIWLCAFSLLELWMALNFLSAKILQYEALANTALNSYEDCGLMAIITLKKGFNNGTNATLPTMPM